MTPEAIKALDDRNACRFPHGDPKQDDFSYCGKPALPGRWCCAEHYEVRYVRERKRAS